MKYSKMINGKRVIVDVDNFTKNIWERLGYEEMTEEETEETISTEAEKPKAGRPSKKK